MDAQTRQADSVITAVSAMLRVVYRNDTIPPLKLHPPDKEGSVLIEWISPDFRFGFNIEPDTKDSGWHIVAGEKFGDLGLYRTLTDIDEPVRTVRSMLRGWPINLECNPS